MTVSMTAPSQETFAVPASSWLERLAAEPALVVLGTVLVVGVVAVLTLERLRRLVREACSRAALQDYLFGVEQALSGDYESARDRLTRVLAEDPENHHARALLSEVLLELGDPVSAHREQLYLQRAFQVHSSRNDLNLARSLVAVGRPAEAAEAIRRAHLDAPLGVDAARLLFKAELAAGIPEEAGRTAAHLVRLLPPGPERDRARAGGARAIARAAQARLQRGDEAGAVGLAREAGALLAGTSVGSALAARLALADGDPGRALQLLTAPEPAPRAQLPAVAAAQAPAALPPPAAPIGHGARALLALHDPAAGPLRCRACGAPMPRALAVCGECGGQGTAVEAEPGLARELESPGLVMDEVEETRAHVRRLVAAATAGDGGASLALVEMGTAAVEDVLAAALRGGAGQEALVDVLQRIGPMGLPALFEAFGKLKARSMAGILPWSSGDHGPSVLGRVVQGFGREALPHFQQLLDTDDRDLRKVIVDFYVGLADQTEFHMVLDRFPPVEVIQRLNAAPRGVLEAFLRTVEPGSFVADGLLVDAMFRREEELLLAAEGREAGVQLDILARRGFSTDLAAFAVERLADDAARPVARAALIAYGAQALDVLLEAYADLDRPAGQRAEVRDLMLRIGPPIVVKVSQCFGPSPSLVDEELTSLIAGLGAEAVVPLCAAYERKTLLERVGGQWLRRYNHPRASLLRVLSRIGGEAARAALTELRGRESDPNLRLRIEQALHALAESEAAPGTRSREPGGGAGRSEASHG
jgi:Tfp pilus assembly protein PilF